MTDFRPYHDPHAYGNRFAAELIRWQADIADRQRADQRQLDNVIGQLQSLADQMREQVSQLAEIIRQEQE